MSEMKENRFRRIAGARVNKIINMLKLLGNCSHTGNYSYTKQQVEEIFGRLRSEVDEAYKRYQMCMKNAHLFSLSEESESAYPSASLLLPDGSLLTAKAIDDDNFPAIDVVLLSKNEEEKICFVEFNPERERGIQRIKKDSGRRRERVLRNLHRFRIAFPHRETISNRV